MDAATDLLMKIVVMLETRSKLDNDKNWPAIITADWQWIMKIIGEDNREKGKYNLAEQLLDVV
jgi:hypothetical protein